MAAVITEPIHPHTAEPADMYHTAISAPGTARKTESAFSMGLSRLWRLRSVNWADMTGPLPSRRSITYNLLYVKSLAVEEDSQ